MLKMLKRIMAVAALVLATGLIAAGCGDDDDDTTTSAATTTTGATGATGATGTAGPALSEDEFLEQGNEICDQVNQTINEGNPGDEQFITQEVVPSIEDALAELGQLTPPEADQEQYAQLLDEGQEGLESLKDDPGAFGPDTFDEFNRTANQLGLDKCGG
jgi:hypothetical protein